MIYYSVVVAPLVNHYTRSGPLNARTGCFRQVRAREAFPPCCAPRGTHRAHRSGPVMRGRAGGACRPPRPPRRASSARLLVAGWGRESGCSAALALEAIFRQVRAREGFSPRCAPRGTRAAHRSGPVMRGRAGGACRLPRPPRRASSARLLMAGRGREIGCSALVRQP